jgi:signal transduction histidine kinase
MALTRTGTAAPEIDPIRSAMRAPVKPALIGRLYIGQVVLPAIGWSSAGSNAIGGALDTPHRYSGAMSGSQPDTSEFAFGFDLRRLLGLMVGATLLVLWGGYALLTISERGEAVTAAKDGIASIAVATAQYAQLIGQVEHRPPLGEQPIGLATAPQEPTTRAMAVFLASLRPATGTRVFLRATTPHERADEHGTLKTADVELVETEPQDRLLADANSANGRIAATVTIARADALASWRSGAILEGAALAIITLIVAFFSLSFHRQLRGREQMTGALHTAMKQAEEGSRAKSEFLANMSHELRTPMNAILGFSEILACEQFGPLGNPRYREYAGDIHQSGRHLLALINDILDLSRLGAGKLELRREPLDLAACLGDCAREMSQAEGAAKVKVSTAFEAGLPLLLADETRLRQIVLNLLSNAIKFTNAGGEVTFAARRRKAA